MLLAIRNEGDAARREKEFGGAKFKITEIRLNVCMRKMWG
jgi:hypothetical protein